MVSGFGEQRNRKPLFQMLDRNALRLGKAEYSEYSWLWWSSYPAPGDVVCAGVLVGPICSSHRWLASQSLANCWRRRTFSPTRAAARPTPRQRLQNSACVISSSGICNAKVWTSVASRVQPITAPAKTGATFIPSARPLGARPVRVLEQITADLDNLGLAPNDPQVDKEAIQGSFDEIKYDKPLPATSH